MTEVAGWLGPRVARSRLLGMLLPAAIVVALVALPAAAAQSVLYPSPGFTPTSWSNGHVLCVFAPGSPAVTVSAVADAGAGMTVGLSSLTQSSVAGVLSASASAAGATWVATNASYNTSTTSVYAMSYAAELPVHGLLDLPLGSANVTMQVSLVDNQTPSAGAAGQVSVSLSVRDWPWQLDPGHLVANITVAPGVPGTERLVEGGPTGAMVSSVSTANGSTLAYLAVAASGNYTPTSGLGGIVGVVASVLGLTAGGATISLTFGAAANDARSMNDTDQVVAMQPGTTITLPGPTGPVQIPIWELLGVAGAAIVASVAVAGGVRRARHAPSDLEYVEEEQP